MENASVEELLQDFRPFPNLDWGGAIGFLSAKASTNERIPKDLDRLISSGRKDWKELGRLLTIAGDYSMSQKAYYNAFDPSVKNHEVLNALVYTFRLCKQNAEAIKLYSAKFRDCPTDLSTLEKLANLHFETGRYNEAVKFYEEFLKISPNDGRKKRMLDTAKKLIRQAIKEIDESENQEQLKEVRDCLVNSESSTDASGNSLRNTVLAVTLAAAIISAVADSKEAYKNTSEYMSEIYIALSEHLDSIVKKWIKPDA